MKKTAPSTPDMPAVALRRLVGLFTVPITRIGRIFCIATYFALAAVLCSLAYLFGGEKALEKVLDELINGRKKPNTEVLAAPTKTATSQNDAES
jgi:hypothetical protein